MCHGCWDVLHYGHLLHLLQARTFGDMLVVSVTADEFVNKGPGKPRFNVDQRMAMLRALRMVDMVICSDDFTPDAVIRYVRPAVYVKGKEYEGMLPEQELVESLGGEVKFIETEASHIHSREIA